MPIAKDSGVSTQPKNACRLSGSMPKRSRTPAIGPHSPNASIGQFTSATSETNAISIAATLSPSRRPSVAPTAAASRRLRVSMSPAIFTPVS